MTRAGVAVVDFEGDFSSLRAQIAREGVTGARLYERSWSSAQGRSMRQSRGYNAIAKQQGKNFQFIGNMAKYAGISVAGFATYGLAQAIKVGVDFEQQISP
jgi:hypothetical protein